jgi:phosphoglycolate phosphatase
MNKTSKHPITVIFDFDGTIADTFLFYFNLLNRLAEKFNFDKIDPEKIDFYRNLNSHEIIELLKIPPLRLPFFVYEARKLLKKEIELIKPIPGIKETITYFKDSDIRLGIITSNSVKNVQTFLKRFDFPHFDFVFSSLRIWEKSHTLLKVLSRNKLDPQSVFYIGDETRDIEAAHDAGVKAVAVTWGYNSEAILKTFSPEHLVSSTQSLQSLIARSLSGQVTTV